MPTITDDTETTITVQFTWDKRHGECYDCGLPAAFLVEMRYGYSGNDEYKRCAVCAANAAADGENIRRIETD